VARSAAAAVIFPGLITLIAALPVSVSTTSAALGYVLGVTAAAVTGGSAAGLGASILAFLALNYFFTPPLYTFVVDKTEDLVALVVFLLVSVVVGTLVSRTLAQRAVAQRREREARLLHHLSTRLLSGEPPDRVLERFAAAVTDLFGLARCEVTVDVGERITAEAGGPSTAGLQSETFPVAAHGQEVGRITTFLDPDAAGLGQDERDLVRTFAGQMALALEGLRLSAEARDARVDAERSRLQAALLSSVTHDLRTPLASITAAVTSLLGAGADFSPDDHRDLLETIHQEADRLNRLVGNLLDVSRLRAGALVPSKRLEAIDEVIEGVLARLDPLLRGHHLNVVLREDLPEVPMDVLQIDQALTNILENAAKFSPPNSQISISAARWQDEVQVRVADQGHGIPADLRDRVFEPFVHSEDGPAAGTGLGLAIAHAVVVAHGGTIWIEPAPGGGTAVLFRLPVRESS
jgi:two-component system, OmpR family, sensor histidine kinase KdpD